MESKWITLLLCVLVICSCAAPAMAREPKFVYTVFVNFSSYAGVDSISVSLHDQTGRIVATTTSPFGGDVAITFMTPTQVSTLTATAYGRVSFGSYYDQYARTVTGTTTIVVGSDLLYYWITVWMR